MRAKTTNLVYQYALIACISSTLLLGQALKLHMHIQHNANPDASTSVQILDVHIASSLHDTSAASEHDDSHHNHHVTEVDISSDSLVKKIELLSFFSLLFFMVSTLLFRQRTVHISRPDIIEFGPPTSLYLLHPPLRAPPH